MKRIGDGWVTGTDPYSDRNGDGGRPKCPGRESARVRAEVAEIADACQEFSGAVADAIENGNAGGKARTGTLWLTSRLQISVLGRDRGADIIQRLRSSAILLGHPRLSQLKPEAADPLLLEDLVGAPFQPAAATAAAVRVPRGTRRGVASRNRVVRRELLAGTVHAPECILSVDRGFGGHPDTLSNRSPQLRKGDCRLWRMRALPGEDSGRGAAERLIGIALL